MTGLLPLEDGLAVRGCRDQRLRSRLLSLPEPADAGGEVDLVLLAAATAILHEGPEDAAAYRAQEVLAVHPDRPGLAELVSAVTTGVDVTWPMIDRYLVFAGYGSDSFSAFQAVGDIYLGRVHRRITHPVLGAGCVAYFYQAGVVESLIAPTTISCHRWWVEWQAPGADHDTIEQQARQFADDWAVNRLRHLHAAGLGLPAGLR